MHKVLKKILKAVANLLTTSFFFICLLTLILYITIGETLKDYITIVNKLSIKNDVAINKELSFDSVKKKLITYPAYGQIFATVSIPKINVKNNLYHGDDLSILKKGIGHYVASYFPGEGGTIILSAHNDYGLFIDLYKLQVKDQIIIEASYGTYTYEVTSYEIIKKQDLEKLELQHEREELILYTCYPNDIFSFKTKRYVVYAKLVGDKNG